MSPTTKRIVVSLALLVGAQIIAPQTQGNCDNARLLVSPAPVVTPGIQLDSNGNPLEGTTVTSNFNATFWALGSGDPTPGAGNDSGGFSVGDWVRSYPGYPAYLRGHWAADPRIDGCIDDAELLKTVVLFSDIDPQTQEGVFAVVELSADRLRNYVFDPNAGDHEPSPMHGAGAPSQQAIRLVPIPSPTIVHASMSGPGELEVLAHIGSVAREGFYAAATDALVKGYRLFYRSQSNSPATPDDRRRSSDWTLAKPLADEQRNEAIEIDSPLQFRIACQPGSEVRLAASLVFDSGFELPVLSADAKGVVCGPGSSDERQ